VVKGDRFIVRLPSPSITLGGGVVIDPQPGRRHRRFRPDVIARLETLAKGTPPELLLQTLEQGGPIAANDLFQRTSLASEEARAALEELFAARQALSLSETIVISAGGWASIKNKIANELNAYHHAHPLKPGLPREELKSRLGLDTKLFNLVVEQAAREGRVAGRASNLRAPDFEITFKPEQQRALDALLLRFKAAPWVTPAIKEAEQAVGADVLAALIDLGRLIKIGEDVLLLPETYQAAVEKIKDHLHAGKTITVAQVRDLFNTSRKYALALMEYLDAHGVTKRVGDERVLAK